MNGIISKSELIELIFRHKLKIIFIPIAVMAMTIAVMLFFPRQYRSEAKLFLQIGRQSLGIDATANLGSSAGLVQSNRDEEVKSALQVIISRGVISQVVEKLGPEFVLNGIDPNDPDQEGEQKKKNAILASIQGSVGQVLGILKSIDPVSPKEDAVMKVESGLKVGAERNSMVLNATFDAMSPKAAQKVLDTLITVYQSEHLRIHRNRQSGSFLSTEREKLLEQYTNVQQKVKQLKNESGISSIEGRRTSIEARIQMIEMEKIQNLQNLTSSRARIEDLKTQLVSIPERETSSQKSIPNGGADLLRKELYTSQIRMMDLKSRLAPDHPQLVATNKQVEEARRLVDDQDNARQETVDDINPIYRALSLELRQQESVVAGLNAKQKELQTQYAEHMTNLECFNQHAIDLTKLEQEEQIARDKYLQYTNSFEQALTDEALETSKISSVSVAQNATLAERPVSPSKPLLLLGGLFLSVSGVLGLVFLSEKMNDRIRSESDLSNLLDLPVLVTIPDSVQHRQLLAR